MQNMEKSWPDVLTISFPIFAFLFEKKKCRISFGNTFVSDKTKVWRDIFSRGIPRGAIMCSVVEVDARKTALSARTARQGVLLEPRVRMLTKELRFPKRVGIKMGVRGEGGAAPFRTHTRVTVRYVAVPCSPFR